MSNSITQALARLIESEAPKDSGRYAGLRAFIDPGRGDIYIEGVNGQRICISEGAKTVTYCSGEWKDGEREVAPL